MAKRLAMRERVMVFILAFCTNVTGKKCGSELLANCEKRLGGVKDVAPSSLIPVPDAIPALRIARISAAGTSAGPNGRYQSEHTFAINLGGNRH